MKRLTAILCLTLALLLGSAGVSVSADLQKGLDAYENGDLATALRELGPLAKQGDAVAQYALGELYMYEKDDPETALKWFRLAAEQDGEFQEDAQMQVEMLKELVASDKYADGFNRGLDAAQRGDYATALREWEPLAEQGDAYSQFNLGQMYNEGQGVPQNDKTALKWYRLAAEQGYADAQYALGVMYENGQGVPQNDKTALKWYRLAAEQSYAIGQNALGNMYDLGRGVPKDDKESVKWRTLAAEQGNAPAQSNLGVMYYNGQGVTQDKIYAYLWWSSAASGGYKQAIKYLGIVERQMTPAQIAEAQKLARECVRKKYKGC